LSFPKHEICHLLSLRQSWSADACDALAQLGTSSDEGEISFDALVEIKDIEIAEHLVGPHPDCTLVGEEGFRSLLKQIEAKWRLPVAMAYQRAAQDEIEEDIALIPTAPLSEDPTGGFKRMAFVIG
jgi:hypothetical protein